MERNGLHQSRLCILGLYVCFASISLVQCDDATKIMPRYRAGTHSTNSNNIIPKEFHPIRKFSMYMPLDVSNTDPYVSSPFSMPPFDSLSPYPSPENTPPYCVNPPFTPQPPSTIPSPTGGSNPSPVPTLPGPNPIPNPPPSSPEGTSPPQTTPLPNPPIIVPSPPQTTPLPNPPVIVPNPPSTVPSPTEPILSPPYYEPSPPSSVPSPPYNIPSPSGSIPSPRFLPPIVFPPPTVPPPPRRTPATAMWCVAKAAVPEPIIQEAMNYACASGADCDQIQSNGSCFEPNTLFAHASYAFNSYWQRTKVAGGTCDFGGTALVVTVDPSYDGCHFIYF